MGQITSREHDYRILAYMKSGWTIPMMVSNHKYFYGYIRTRRWVIFSASAFRKSSHSPVHRQRKKRARHLRWSSLWSLFCGLSFHTIAQKGSHLGLPLPLPRSRMAHMLVNPCRNGSRISSLGFRMPSHPWVLFGLHGQSPWIPRSLAHGMPHSMVIAACSTAQISLSLKIVWLSMVKIPD
jgi:hypothetical protein